jgi:hypothetical protein
MGVAGSAPLFETALLDPLLTCQAISDNDDYWKVLFSRAVEEGTQSTIRAALEGIAKRRPQNLNQLVHVATLNLIDILHRVSLTPTSSENKRLHTTLTLLFYALAVARVNSQVLNLFFDDCGVISTTLTTALVRLLHMPGVTVPVDSLCWSDDRVDVLRLAAVDVLLACAVGGCQFLEFPKKLFATSVAHSIRLSHGHEVRNESAHYELLGASLLLLLASDTSLLEADLEEEKQIKVFAPVLETINRETGYAEIEAYIVPLLIQFMMWCPPNILSKMTPAFLYNVLIAAAFWERKDICKVTLLILVRICQLGGADPAWNIEPNLAFIPDLEAPTWGIALLDIACKSTLEMDAPAALRAFALILAMMIPKVKDMSPHTTERFLKVAIAADEDAAAAAIRSVHWVVNRKLAEFPEWGAAAIIAVTELRQIAERNPEFVECTQLVDWATRQMDNFRATHKEQELSALLNPELAAKKFEVPDDQPAVPFDFRAHAQEMFNIVTCHYFTRYRQVRFAPADVR